MRIGLNGQKILIDNPAGPERFTINLYKYLALNDHENKYVVYLNKQPSRSFIDDLFGANSNFGYKVISTPFLWTQLGLALELFTNPVGVFFSPIHTLPFFRPLKTKYIAMIHGLEYRTNKQFDNKPLLKLWQSFITNWVIWNANKLVVPSEATKKAIGNPNKTVVIYEGVDENFKPRTEQETQNTLQTYNLVHKKYLLFVSTIQPRKNIPNLIKAFANATATNHEDVQLVLVGKLGWNYTDAIQAPNKYNVENKVKFLNWVHQEQLYDLFSAALGYVNFSNDEGFGLTVLEAMASEIPAAVSDIPAHREVGNACVLYANPNDIFQMSKTITTVLEQSYTSELITKAKTRANTFTWNITAQKLIKLFSDLGSH